MKNWSFRLKKIETKVFKINKDEILQNWIENQKLKFLITNSLA